METGIVKLQHSEALKGSVRECADEMLDVLSNYPTEVFLAALTMTTGLFIVSQHQNNMSEAYKTTCANLGTIIDEMADKAKALIT